jgi:hypothetical protein
VPTPGQQHELLPLLKVVDANGTHGTGGLARAVIADVVVATVFGGISTVTRCGRGGGRSWRTFDTARMYRRSVPRFHIGVVIPRLGIVSRLVLDLGQGSELLLL